MTSRLSSSTSLTTPSIRSASRGSARSASSVLPPRSPTRSITRPASGYATCRLRWTNSCVEIAFSKACVDPGCDVIEQIPDRVGILTGAGGARLTGREAVGGALDHHEILVLATRQVVLAFVVANEVVRTHGGEQHGHRNRLHRTDSRIIGRTVVNVVGGIAGPNRLGAQERAQREHLRAGAEGKIPARRARVGNEHAFDDLRRYR